MVGLTFKKSLIWHLAQSAILAVGILGGAAMVIGISFVTFTLYIVTGAAHLLSLPGMAILACAVVLLARDELSGIADAFLWQKFRISVIRTCIRGSFTYQSGWLIAENNNAPTVAFTRFIARLIPNKKSVRVMKVTADDGEVFVVGWDVRPLPMHDDGVIWHPNGQKFRFVKHLFD